ncbi:GGDEF domain-containing protein [Pseudoalteromonas sp. H105]|jgi:diguanylate cyclase (GGDEF)-like protein|uniref:GGDEF domain-containing protein n=1 Tax=Pseudoalteromonas sp. H105 TaxID=1348393 RepID=UPI0007320ED7|nr:GGDEF domain-containing protein [Pseudoalteromonas sp. H105]KTF18024.1 hypothetical protein ATS75_00990 [Pseudoalteromonas sp. H105]
MLHLPTVIGISLFLNMLISSFFLCVYLRKKQSCYLYFALACSAFALAEILACLRVIIDNAFITHYLADLLIITSPLFAIIGLQLATSSQNKSFTSLKVALGGTALVLMPIYDVIAGQLLTSFIIACLFLVAANTVYKMKTNAVFHKKILLGCFVLHSVIMFIQVAILGIQLMAISTFDFSQPLQVILINHLFLATTTALIMPFVLFADIEAKLQRLVNRDTLTSLLNRRGFFIDGEKTSRHVIKHHQDLAVVMIDIDFFKNVNDQYGHSTGDMAIKWIAQHILSQLNDHDIAARIGGEEFALILPEQSHSQATHTAQIICNVIRQHTLKYKGNTINLSVSIGVACKDNKTQTIKGLLDLADKRLYVAKSQGRDQVVAIDSAETHMEETILLNMK